MDKIDKIMMNQLIRKIAYQYQCDINFSDKCLILCQLNTHAKGELKIQ